VILPEQILYYMGRFMDYYKLKK